MRLGGTADHLAIAHNKNELQEAVAWAKSNNLPFIVIGGGSNIVWRDEGFRGLVIVNQLSGYGDHKNEDGTHTVTIGAGETWDEIVRYTVESGLTGIEALSLIPGTAGATPIQNVGAYGQEISQTLVSVEALDTETNQYVTLQAKDCGFSYRDSKFKHEWRGKYIVAGLTLLLNHDNPEPPFYGAIEAHLVDHPVNVITPEVLRDAVTYIRRTRLPDPFYIANNGSFFANPVISEHQLHSILHDYPDAPHWSNSDGTAKIYAAWLIDQAGFKNWHDQETGMATWEGQSLVLVNEYAKSTADLLKFRDKIISAVKTKFDIELRQEPELLP